MDKLPFSVYDFFGYLASGFVLLVGLAASFAGTSAWQKDTTTVITLFLIVAAYSVGHVVANLSGFVLESKLVGSWLGRPTTNLFREGPALKWRRRLFPGYYKALPEPQRLACLRKSGLTADAGEGLFYRCFAAVKTREDVLNRLNTFLNLYGFCRNMSMALLVVSPCVVIGSLLDSAKTGDLVPPGWWAAGGIVAAIGLLYRYLKFFRHYAVEVFVTYAE